MTRAVCPECGTPSDQPCPRMMAADGLASPALCVASRPKRVDAKTRRTAAANGRGKTSRVPRPSGRPSWLLDSRDMAHAGCDVSLGKDAVSTVKVTVSKRAFETIKTNVGYVNGQIETGGVLLGLRKLGEIWVSDAGSAGRRAYRGRDSFRHDPIHDQEFARSLGHLVPVGEWHSHPGGTTTPSDEDLQLWASMRTPYLEDARLGVIVTGATLNAWVLELGGRVSHRPWFKCRRAASVDIC